MVLMLGLGKDWILNVFDGCLALKKKKERNDNKEPKNRQLHLGRKRQLHPQTSK